MAQPKRWRWFLWGARVYELFSRKELCTVVLFPDTVDGTEGQGAMVLHRKAMENAEGPGVTLCSRFAGLLTLTWWQDPRETKLQVTV